MSTEIVIALIGFLGVIATALIGYAQARLKTYQLNQAELELKFQRTALGFSEFLPEWEQISAEIERLMVETNIDRFLIFRAWNGHLEPRWTTAIYQVRKGDQMPLAYIHFELDADYQNKLREIVGNNELLIDSRHEHDTAISSLYQTEGVTGALWCHLDSFGLPNSHSKAIIYCSYATRSPEGLDLNATTRARILTSRLKGIVHSFGDRPIK